MNLPEKTISSREIYTGKVLSLKVLTVEIEDQKYSQREIINHPGGTCIVAVNPSGKLILVKQYRKAIDSYIIELPAGKLESKENPEDSIKRELIEETGYIVEDVEFITSMYTSPGYSDEKLYLYYGKTKDWTEPRPDGDEAIEVIEIDIDEAIKMIKNKEIIDTKTLVGIQWFLINKSHLE
ncbi:ADP-ribose pyrophosphatase [Acetoanaerobium pronyense]|uniref:ADP-ribose pyrophosphatase n=1 Tax=Acetoanaerobium pronyense TaxID=1482736 RepID=A0ABS4KII9_9FIRM|nr:NUDIX hydrolase [Acetoanaerobium pronyense]MBP2027602.1 ADP-ribose pyrophosphatase [Acetoanaerobium pronyense]